MADQRKTGDIAPKADGENKHATRQVDHSQHLRDEGYGSRQSEGQKAERRESARPAEGDLARIPPQAMTDMDRSENFVLKEIERFTRLMPKGEDPRSVPPLETQEQVDARFASINWKEYGEGRKVMQERTDAQKQQLSEFDRNLLDLLEQQTLLKNNGTVNLLGDGLARNAGKYKDLLQTFNKDLQAIGRRCDLKEGRFTIE